jgi:hypothetical protein
MIVYINHNMNHSKTIIYTIVKIDLQLSFIKIYMFNLQIQCSTLQVSLCPHCRPQVQATYA